MIAELFILAQDVGAAARATVPSSTLIERLLIPAPGLAVICVGALVAQFILRRRVDWQGVALAVGILVLNWLLLWGGKLFQITYTDLSWNWPGKIAAIVVTLLLIRFVWGHRLKEMGFTWRQRPGSVGPVLIVFALFCAFTWGVEYSLSDAPLRVPPLETIAFQAFMPSLDEEPIFRGLVLMLLMAALSERGSWYGPAAVSLCIAFGLNHAVSFADGMHFNALAFALTTSFAVAATWIRLRSGSVVFPLLLHSAVNLGLACM